MYITKLFGLTFEMCQIGIITDYVYENIVQAVQWFNEKNVSGITGDCGFMIHIQHHVRAHTQKPVFMSSLIQLPTIVQAYSNEEQIAVFTANGRSLRDMSDLIYNLCNVDIHDERLILVGCEDVDGFEAVALGEKVNTSKVEPNIVKKAVETLEQYPKVKCFLMECTELPPYSDAIRKHTGLPVFDSITCARLFHDKSQRQSSFWT